MTTHGDDVMEPPYFSEIAPLLPAPSYPYAFLNRSVSGDPASMPVSRTLTEKSTGNLKISRVDYSSSAGSAMTVHYGTALSYNTQDPVVRVSAYIIEDDVKSTASNYKQKNNYSGYSDGEIARVFGEALVPYFQNYIKYPAEIPASRMTYNDVARAAFPSAKGELQTEPYTAFVFNEGSIQMSMPSNVMNPENTSVVVVMADREGKNVMSADVVKFADYNKELYTFSGQPVYPEGYSPITKIDVCPAENEILIEDGKIRVLTSVPATILVHSLDGTLIAKSEKGSGESVLHPETKGLVIVTVRTASGVSTKKLIL